MTIQNMAVSVRGGKKDLGNADYQVGETIEDLIAIHTEPGLIALANGAAKTKAANEHRKSRMPAAVSTKSLEKILMDFKDPQDLAAFAEAMKAGDTDAMKKLIAKSRGIELQEGEELEDE